MKKLVFTALMLIPASVLAFAKDAKSADQPGKPLMEKILAAWSSGDPTKATPFYDQAAGNIYFDVAPLQYHGFSEYVEGAKQVVGMFQTFKLTVNDDVQVHPSGSWAWATATFKAEGKMVNGNGLSEQGRWTVIWQKKGGKWLVVHEHVSFPWTPPTERRQR